MTSQTGTSMTRHETTVYCEDGCCATAVHPTKCCDPKEWYRDAQTFDWPLSRLSDLSLIWPTSLTINLPLSHLSQPFPKWTHLSPNWMTSRLFDSPSSNYIYFIYIPCASFLHKSGFTLPVSETVHKPIFLQCILSHISDLYYFFFFNSNSSNSKEELCVYSIFT